MADQDFETFKQVMGDAIQTPESGKPTGQEQQAQAPAMKVLEIELDKSEAPKAETPKQEDFNSLLSGKFGRDEQTLARELEELGTLRESVKANPYKSAIGEQIDRLIAQGASPEAAVRYVTADESKLTDKEVLMFKMQRDMPDSNSEQISRYIEKKYGIGAFAPQKDDGEGNMIKDEEAEKDNLFAMAMDSKAIRKEFKDIKEELVKPRTSREQVENQTKEQQRVSNWKPIQKKLLEEFKHYNIPYGIKDGKPMINLKAAVKDFNVNLEAYIQSNHDLIADENGLQTVRQAMEDAYLLQNKADIFKKVGEWARSQSEENWHKLIHNPSIKAPQSDFGGNASNKSRSDQLVEGWQKVL